MDRNAPGNQFDREKFATATCEAFLGWRKRQQLATNFSNHAMIASLRRHFFADIDALEKTGEVRLP